MFGNLLGTLQKFTKDEVKQKEVVEKQKVALMKVEVKLNKAENAWKPGRQVAGVPPSPCFPIFLARTTFVLESLPEAKNPGQDAFLGDFVFNSSYSRDNSLLD